ncbi:MAG: hypothetical protein U5K69_26460 [Balneolaceae bacterium]|nr:hypothetical protein [Balneolaceae bacterium]
MNLNDFEQQIAPKIVDRGYRYFQDDRVDGPELIEEGLWLATVYGSESYRVEIRTDPQNSHTIHSWHCDCPYDYGPVCKHVAAALFEMAERESSESDSSHSKATSTTKDRIQEIFKNTSRDELQKFIMSCIKSVDGFKNRFLAHFGDRLGEDPVQQYRQIIRNYAKAAEDHYGFIDYRSAPTLTRSLWELNNKANELLEAGQIRESMALCQTLIEEIAKIYEMIDDSDGGAGDVVMQAFDTLDSIAQSATSTSKEELFEWCMQEFSLQKYHELRF